MSSLEDGYRGWGDLGLECGREEARGGQSRRDAREKRSVRHEARAGRWSSANKSGVEQADADADAALGMSKKGCDSRLGGVGNIRRVDGNDAK